MPRMLTCLLITLNGVQFACACVPRMAECRCRRISAASSMRTSRLKKAIISDTHIQINEVRLFTLAAVVHISYKELCPQNDAC
jgi:hypothetical protein